MLTLPKHHLRELLLIRLIVLLALSGGLIYAAITEASHYISAAALVLGLWAALTALSLLRYRQIDSHRGMEFFAQLCLDVMLFAAFLYFTGGASNPLVSFFLVPISIAATTLGFRLSAALTGIALIAYSQLLFFHLPLELFAPSHDMHGMHDTADSPINLHVLGMWFNFLLSAAIITLFCVRLSAQLRDADQRLAELRENRLQDEQLLAVAAVTAGAAHELGTPLNTLTLLADEMQPGDPPEQRQLDLEMLRQQLGDCKHSLSEIVETARQSALGNTPTLPLKSFVRSLQSRWDLLRPDTTLDIACRDERVIKADAGLIQTLINLMNNAADNSPARIGLHVAVEQERLLFSILDYGEAIEEAALLASGLALESSKAPRGRGLGLFLSNATARRLGGELQYQARESGDQQANKMTLSLPLNKVQL